MCKRRAVTLVSLAVGSLWTVNVSAQKAEQYRARIEPLVAVAESSQAVMAQLMERSRATLSDTVRVGYLTILTHPNDRDAVFEGAQIAWPQIRHRLGDRSEMMALRPIWAGTNRLSYGHAWRDSWSIPMRPREASSEAAANIAQRLVTLASRVALDTLGAQRNWTGQEISTSESELPWIYHELATSRSFATRECFRGDLQACRDAFVFEQRSDSLQRWYSSAERRGLVASNFWPQPGSVSDCLQAFDDDACTRILQTSSEFHVPRPLSRAAHQSLVAIAIDIGGEGSLARFVAGDRVDLVSRFEASTGIPIDSLLAMWRDTVMAHRPLPTTLHASAAWSAALWIGLCLVAAARSTRWRFR